MKRLRFTRSQRLTTRADFLSALRRGRTRAAGDITFKIRQNGLGLTRLGIITRKKLGNAVVRNRARRLVREAFRLAQLELPAGLDVVAVPQAVPTCSVAELRELLVRTLS